MVDRRNEALPAPTPARCRDAGCGGLYAAAPAAAARYYYEHCPVHHPPNEYGDDQ